MRSPGSDRILFIWGFPGGSNSEESASNAGAPCLIPGSERSPGEGKGNPLQLPALRIPWREELGGQQPLGMQSHTRLNDEHFPFHSGVK